MKNLFTFLVITLITITTSKSFSQDQLENGSFENWEYLEIKDTLNTWFTTNQMLSPFAYNVSKTTDGFSGNAVLLESVLEPDGDEIITGGIVLAQALGDDIPVGFPYDSEVDNLNAYLKFDIAPTDTGFAMVILETGGVPFSLNTFPIYGTQDTWELFTWDLTDALITPDAVTVVFFSGGNEGSEPVEGSWLEIDNVFFGNAGATPAPLANFEFEDWYTISIETSTNWFSLDPLLVDFIGVNNISKSTDATDGSYSLFIETLELNVENDIIPFISNGEFDIETEEILGGSDFTGKPILFKGDYKFLSDVNDSASIYLNFWNNTGDNQEYGDNLLPMTEWTEFSIPVDLDFTPDSLLTVLFAGSLEGSEIFYDNLRFVYNDVGVSENSLIDLNLYPNPANDMVNVLINEPADIVITDLIGNLRYSQTHMDTLEQISTNSWPNGIYLIQVYRGNSFETKRLVVQH